MLGKLKIPSKSIAMLVRMLYSYTDTLLQEREGVDQIFVIRPGPPILTLARIKNKQPTKQVQPLNS